MTIEPRLAAMLAFALRHDWGQDATLVDGTLQVTEECTDTSGHHSEAATFRSLPALRKWAGY